MKGLVVSSTVAFVMAVLATACSEGGSPVAPSAVAPITLTTQRGEVRYTRWPDGQSFIEYTACYQIAPPADVTAAFALERGEATVFGPSGQPYGTSRDDMILVGALGGGLFGCPTLFMDTNLTRPVATSFEMRVVYSTTGQVGTRTVVSSGSFVSRVPRLPLMSGVAVTHDIADPRRVLRRPTPLTFTASGAGGHQPYQFKWSLSGFVLQDWSTNPTLVWDGITLAPRYQITNGDHDLLVQGRSDGNSGPEASTTVRFTIAY